MSVWNGLLHGLSLKVSRLTNMTPWTFIETLIDTLYYLCHWRFSVCFLASLALAAVAWDQIPQEPLRWIASGAIVVTGLVIGFRWDRS